MKLSTWAKQKGISYKQLGIFISKIKLKIVSNLNLEQSLLMKLIQNSNQSIMSFIVELALRKINLI